MQEMPESTSRKIKLWLLDRFLPIKTDIYQRQRFPEQKFATILQNIDLAAIGSVLDIGCNEGLITKYFADQGKFAVGIDNSPFFVRNVLHRLHATNTPVFGTISLTPANVATLPTFDLVLVLSVHHWWVKEYGDRIAQGMIRDLAARSRRCLVIEFAAIRDKYGYERPRFIDNDDSSVIEYATGWLKEIDESYRIKYLGKNQETTGRERFRHIFLVDR